MRTAQICPTCATYTNAVCVIYDGAYLSNINVSPLDNLSSALVNINTAVGQTNQNINSINANINIINNNISSINNTISGIYPLHGTLDPSLNSSFIGQSYINTATGQMFYSISTGVGTIWKALCDCIPIGSRIFSNAFSLTFN